MRPTIAAVTIAAALLVPATPARGAEAEPAVASSAWYWEDQVSQPITDPTSGADIAVIELPNPWCPGTPVSTPEQTCHDGRLPVEVRNGDYETPNKISAVAFDLALVPIGSDVSKFEVTFRESPGENEIPSQNHAEKELQACVITDFFGDGYAREYEEAPKFTCSETDPRAKRSELAGGGGGDAAGAFGWKFDLTTIAQTWMEETSAVTAIMLMPAVPEGKEDPAAADPRDSWRVVLAGPLAENGVITRLVYKPPPVPTTGGTGSTGNTTDTFGGGAGSGFDTSGGFDTGTTDDGLDTGADAPPDVPTPAPTGTPVVAAPTGGEPEEPGLPGYFWLALIGGLVGASLLKSAVLEQTTGTRPGGVLAQIRDINSLRRGAPAAAAAGAGAASGRSLGSAVRSAAARLNVFKRR